MCLIIALDVKMLSWFDMLRCTNHTHIHRRDCWHKGKSLEHGRRCTAAALLLHTDLVTVHTPRTHAW